MQDPYAHVGSRTNLLGETPNPQLVNELSNELQVSRNTPSTFLFHTTDDEFVPVENSLQLYGALRRAGVPPNYTFTCTAGMALGWPKQIRYYERGRSKWRRGSTHPVFVKQRI
jgi:predicted peptidase